MIINQVSFALRRVLSMFSQLDIGQKRKLTHGVRKFKMKKSLGNTGNPNSAIKPNKPIFPVK